MNISRKKKVVDVPLAWRKMLADIPNGGSVKAAEIRTAMLYDGTPVYYSSSDHLWHPIYTAVLQANAANNAVKYKVEKGHSLKVGDYLYNGSTGYAISAIDTDNANYDEVTIGTTLGTALSAGAVLVAGGSGGATPNPQGLVVGHHVVESGMNLETGIGVIGTVMAVHMKTHMTSDQKAALKGIVFVD